MMTLEEAKIEAEKRWGDRGYAHEFKTSRGTQKSVGYYYDCHCCGQENNEDFNGDNWETQTWEEAFRQADAYAARQDKK